MGLNIAVFGDIHGKLDLMYSCCKEWEENNGMRIDIVAQTGDFQTIRNEEDLKFYFAPEKYRKMELIGDFAKYLPPRKDIEKDIQRDIKQMIKSQKMSEEEIKKEIEKIEEKFIAAPRFTLFIGGNHEAWNVLNSRDYGNIIAYNMEYLGRSGVCNINGIDIAGISGIYSPKQYEKPLPETIDRTWGCMRKEAVDKLEERLSMIDTQPRILLLHSWITPLSDPSIRINRQKNIPDNLFEGPVSPVLNLIKKYRPDYVFMGHMHHSYFEGIVGDVRLGEPRHLPTLLVGLSELTEEKSEDSYRVVRIE